jgi:hypothetical protein
MDPQHPIQRNLRVTQVKQVPHWNPKKARWGATCVKFSVFYEVSYLPPGSTEIQTDRMSWILFANRSAITKKLYLKGMKRQTHPNNPVLAMWFSPSVRDFIMEQLENNPKAIAKIKPADYTKCPWSRSFVRSETQPTT